MTPRRSPAVIASCCADYLLARGWLVVEPNRADDVFAIAEKHRNRGDDCGVLARALLRLRAEKVGDAP